MKSNVSKQNSDLTWDFFYMIGKNSHMKKPSQNKTTSALLDVDSQELLISIFITGIECTVYLILPCDISLGSYST